MKTAKLEAVISFIWKEDFSLFGKRIPSKLSYACEIYKMSQKFMKMSDSVEKSNLHT